MRICSIRHISVECSLPVLLIIPLAGIFEMLDILLMAFIALSAHELCHAYMARSFGVGVIKIEIQPFGFVARLKENSFLSVHAELAIASAGPVCSFIIGTAAVAARQLFPAIDEALSIFSSVNLSIAIINLLPALPLDGGRMLRAAISLISSKRTATMITAYIGVVIGAAILALGIYGLIKGLINITVLVMGLFLLIAALKEIKCAEGAQMRAMIRRSDVLRQGQALQVRQLALGGDAAAGTALRLLSSGYYNLIVVIDDRMSVTGYLDEGALLAGIAKKGSDTTLKSLID